MTELADRHKIADLLARLMHRLDHGDRDGFADCWTNDVDFEVAMFDGTLLAASGREALLEITAKALMGNASPLRHVVGPVEIGLLAGRLAETFSYATYYLVGEEFRFAGIGEYEDQLVKCDDSMWRISRRRHRFLTPHKIRPGS